MYRCRIASSWFVWGPWRPDVLARRLLWLSSRIDDGARHHGTGHLPPRRPPQPPLITESPMRFTRNLLVTLALAATTTTGLLTVTSMPENPSTSIT